MQHMFELEKEKKIFIKEQETNLLNTKGILTFNFYLCP